MLKTWQDVQDLFGPKVLSAVAGPAKRQVSEGPRVGRVPMTSGKGRPTDRVSSPKVAEISKEPFADAWKRYCSTNARLRDPRTLPLLVRRGVPEELRAEVWSHCVGLEVVPERTSSQSSLDGDSVVEEPLSPGTFDDLIDVDIARTFPNKPEFQAADGPRRLRRILRRVAADDPDLGYCQSLNFVAAVLLMVLQDEQLVISAVGKLIMKLSIRCWYKDGMQQLRGDTVVLDELLQERLPAVHEAFHAHKFDLTLVTAKWFMCLFTTTLDDDVLRRVWDVILCDGIEAVFRIALALIALRSTHILSAKSADDIVELFQTRQAQVNAEALIRSAYNPELVGQLSRAVLAQRRQQAAASVTSTDHRTELRRIQLARGGVRPASFLNR